MAAIFASAPMCQKFIFTLHGLHIYFNMSRSDSMEACGIWRDMYLYVSYLVHKLVDRLGNGCIQ